MFRQLGLSFDEIRRKYNFWLPRVEASCKFKAPAKFGDLLHVSLAVEEVMEKAVKYDFAVADSVSKQVVAQGYVVVVMADKMLGHAVSIPKELLEKLNVYRK